MTSKIAPYKIVSPGVLSGIQTPKGKLSRASLLSFNRLGHSVEGISSIVKDIVDNNASVLKIEKQILRDREKNNRLEADRAAEERQESKSESLSRRNNKSDEQKSPKLKKKKFGFIESIGNMFKPLVGFLFDIVSISVGASTLQWLSDPNNREALSEFIRKFTFVFKKLYGFISGTVGDIGTGYTKLIDPESDFLTRLKGLGEMLLGFVKLKYLMNPFSLITDLMEVLDLFDNKSDKLGDDKRNKRRDGKKSKVQQSKQTARSAKSTGADRIRKTHGPQAGKAWKAKFDAAKQSGKTNAQATRSANAYLKKLFAQGKLKSKPQAGLSTRANKILGKNIPGKIFKKGIDKATQRFFLKIVGMGGVKALKSIFNKIPVVGPLITFALNWATGEPFLKAAAMGVGAGLGQMLGGWAGGAIGALGGPAAPLTVPIGAFVGAMLGGVGGELIGGWLYDTISGKEGGGGFGAVGRALGKAVQQLLEKDWGEFFAGAWQSILNYLGEAGKNVWNAVSSMVMFAGSKFKSMFDMLMENSKEWRRAVWDSVQKYIMKPIFDIPDLVVKLANVIADQAVKAYLESPKFFSEVSSKIWEGLTKVFETLKNPVKFAQFIGNVLNFTKSIPERFGAIFNVIKDGLGPAFETVMGKIKQVGSALIEPIKEFIDPAVRAIQETWKILPNMGGWLYDNTIKPWFDLAGKLWNSPKSIWEWMNKENTFQETFGAQLEFAKGGQVALYAGHADMSPNDPSGAFGTHGGNVKGNLATGDPTKPGGFVPDAKRNGYLSNEAYFNDMIAKNAAKKTGGLAVYRKPVKTTSPSHSQSNWSRIDRDNAAGRTTIELHQDAPSSYGGRSGTMGINPSMSSRGTKNPILKSLNAAYGIHSAQRGLGAVNPNNLSTLLEIKPLDMKYLRDSKGFIERESTKLANAIKAGAKGKLPAVSETTEDAVKPSSDSGDATVISGDSPSIPDVEYEAPPPPEPPKSFFESIQDMAKSFTKTLGGDLIPSTNPIQRETIGNMEFSKQYALDQNYFEGDAVPFVVTMPVAIATPAIINTNNKKYFVSPSPLLEK